MKGVSFTISKAGWRDSRSTAWFSYEIETDEKTFQLEETLTFPLSVPETTESENILRALHIALAISYFKTFIPPTIVSPYEMDASEAGFWNTVFHHGLGEFMFKNQITEKLAEFSEQEGLIKPALQNVGAWKDGALLGIGGGKDSIVAGELLKEATIPITGFVLATGEELGQTQAVADAMGVELLSVSRVIDPQISELNALPGSFNGHIPISLIFGLVGAMLSVATENKYIAVANESSASIPHTNWQGREINHQWSKSLEFERLFQDYLHAYVSKQLYYTSIIRPLSSVGVSKLFAKYPKYLDVFTSDNSLFKIHPDKRDHPRWSLNSPKSLSSFILLAPWVEKQKLVTAFGRDYLDEPSLHDLLEGLLGTEGSTVLDCVGTPDELRASLDYIKELDTYSGSTLLKDIKNTEKLQKTAELSSFSTLSEHALPEPLADQIMPLLESKL